MSAARRTEEMTPEELEERGQRLEREGRRLLIRAEVLRVLGPKDYYDQHTSPLGKRKHLELARSGKVASRKVRRSVLIRRDDLNAYIEKHGLARGRREQDEDVDDIIDRVMSDDDDAAGDKKR